MPAKDFALSKRFYADLGFTQKSEGGGVAYFACGHSAFLLQDYYLKEFAGVCWHIGENTPGFRPAGRTG